MYPKIGQHWRLTSSTDDFVVQILDVMSEFGNTTEGFLCHIITVKIFKGHTKLGYKFNTRLGVEYPRCKLLR